MRAVNKPARCIAGVLIPSIDKLIFEGFSLQE